jgi:opacity protein-like surface antigen
MMRISSRVLILLLALSVVSIAHSDSDFGVKGLGARFGLIMPEDPYHDGVGFGLHADLGRVTTDISMSAFIDYWSKSFDEDIKEDVPGTWEYSSLGMGADFKYIFPLDARTRPYVGEGLGLVFSKTKKKAERETDHLANSSGSDTDIEFHMLGGIEHRFGPSLKGIAEFKYNVGELKYASLYAGITFMFGD